MFAELEAKIRSLFHWTNRSEWIIRWLKLPVSKDTAEDPGLLLIQIDGFSRHELERAMQAGSMPFLCRLMTQGEYSLNTFYSGLPSTTPAVQAELFYGIRSAVPAFSYRDAKSGEIVSLMDPDLAGKWEDAFAKKTEGLLTGGSSWSNIYSGGSAEPESHFCISEMALGQLWRKTNLLVLLQALLLHPLSVLRVFALVLLELGIGIADALGGLLKGQPVGLEMGTVLSRMLAGIAVREGVTIGSRVDAVRGLPIIHLNFVGYDEMSHRRGPGSAFSHWSLRGIDRSIRELVRAAHGSRRRDYQVWVFSDHGQETTHPFEQCVKGGLRPLIAECLSAESPAHAHKSEAKSDPQTEPYQLADMGPVAHLYLKPPLSESAKHSLARRLAGKGIPAVLLRRDSGEVLWIHAFGEHPVHPGADLPPLAHYPAELRRLISEDILNWTTHPDSGHLLLLGGPRPDDSRMCSYAPENGAHGGVGLIETQGFLLLPPATRLPPGSEAFVRPDALRLAALTYLGRRPPFAAPVIAGQPTDIDVLSYNVHGCCGTDGRISPRRIARILEQSRADLIALQEVDRHRSRSRGEDQTQIIAERLGFHHCFCPTVIRGDEEYGHAIFSRYPIEKIKAAKLPSDPRSWYREDRCALWVSLELGNRRTHFVTAHLGLSAVERDLQIDCLLGNEWLGGIPKNEGILLAGDLNFSPGSRPYKKLIDAGFIDAIKSSAPTFSTLRPMIRLDHLFINPVLQAQRSRVLRNDLTRVASDHLPILARIRLNGNASKEPS